MTSDPVKMSAEQGTGVGISSHPDVTPRQDLTPCLVSAWVHGQQRVVSKVKDDRCRFVSPAY